MADVQELVRDDAAVAVADAVHETLTGTVTEALSEVLNGSKLESGTQFVTPFPCSIHSSGNGQESLNWNAPHPKAGFVVLKTAVALEQLWTEQGGAIADIPQVDFERSIVAAVFAGEGFFREVPSIERVKVLADEVVVYVSRFSRPWSKHNAKAVVQLAQTELPVRFVCLS